MVNYLNRDKNQSAKHNSSLPIPKIGILLLGIFSILLMGLADYVITVDVSLSICYLIPIAIVTKYLDRRSGIFLAIMSAFIWYLAEDAAKTDLNSFLLWWNTLVRLGVFLTVVHLLSTIKDAYKREQNLAQIDGLTQIYNRRFFLDNLRLETKRAIRYQRYLTLVYFDLDNFKSINDRLGHAQGDKLLRLVASTVTKSIRQTDIFARLGGDEFALILPETTYQSSQFALQRIQQELNKIATKEFSEISFSIGAITFQELPDSIDSMLEQVDRLMYLVKNNGKDGMKHDLCDQCNLS